MVRVSLRWPGLFLMLLPVMLPLAGACNRGTKLSRPSAVEQLSDEAAQDGLTYIVTLSELARVSIDATMRRGLPVFRWEENRLKYVDGCYHVGHYEFTPVNKTSAYIGGSNAVDLEANAFKGLISSAANHSWESRAEILFVGEEWSDIETPTRSGLVGPNCSSATHVAKAVQVGAVEILHGKATSGDAAVGVEQVSVRGRYSTASESHRSSGDLEKCRQDQVDGSHDQCKAPLSVSLLAIEMDARLEYHFDTRVIGARTDDEAMTSAELAGIAGALAEDLQSRGKATGVEVVALSEPSMTSMNCAIGAAAKAKQYTLSCARLQVPVVQVSGERQALMSLTPHVGHELFNSLDAKPEQPMFARRVVLLVDDSLSMLVNDKDTFTTNDIRRSKRYEIAMLMLRGMQENGIQAEVAVAPFGGKDCIETVNFQGKRLWSLTDASRVHALVQLERYLTTALKCDDNGTDLVGSLRHAGALLDAPTKLAGRDVVFLITDGNHQTPFVRESPRVAASELRARDIDLVLVRVHLNDFTSFRTTLAGPSFPQIIDRWVGFTGDRGQVEGEWEDWFREEPDKDLEGAALLGDLSYVDVGKIFLGMDDVQSEALLTVHEQLLPELGGLEPVFSSSEITSSLLESEHGLVVTAEYKPRIIRGRSFTIRVKKPECMGKIVNAYVRASKHGRIDLEPLWEEGAIVTFKDIQIDKFDDGGGTTNNEVLMTLEGEAVTGLGQCQN
jgi:hypothetical protein